MSQRQKHGIKRLSRKGLQIIYFVRRKNRSPLRPAFTYSYIKYLAQPPPQIKRRAFPHSSLCFPNNYLSTFKNSSFVILYINNFIFSPVKQSVSIVSELGSCLYPIRSNIFLLYLLRSKHPAVIVSNE